MSFFENKPPKNFSWGNHTYEATQNTASPFPNEEIVFVENNNQNTNALLTENIQCMEQYKVNGKYKMPFSVKDENIYLYLGHGSSRCDENGNLILKKVPDNCIYITQTVCGIVNTLDPNIIKAFCDERNASLWRDPVTNAKKIKKLFEFAPMLHIHFPGCSYVDSGFFPFSDQPVDTMNNDPQIELGLSGLLSLQKAYSIPRGNEWIKGHTVPTPNDAVPVESIEQLFEFSDFPTLQRKSKSVMKATKSRTIDVVTNAEGLVDINQLKSEVNRIANNIPVSDLMEEFPGIHFNFLCRSLVDANCKKEKTKSSVSARRRHSAVLQKSPFETIQKIIVYGHKYGNVDVVTTDSELLNFIKSIEYEIKADRNLKNFYKTIQDLTLYNYPTSLKYLEGIFIADYKRRFIELVKENATIRTIRNFIDILEYSPSYANDKMYDMERQLLGDMAAVAFNADREDIVEKLCEKGAPLYQIQSEYTALRTFLRPNSMKRKTRMLRRCKRSYGRTLKRLRNKND